MYGLCAESVTQVGEGGYGKLIGDAGGSVRRVYHPISSGNDAERGSLEA